MEAQEIERGLFKVRQLNNGQIYIRTQSPEP